MIAAIFEIRPTEGGRDRYLDIAAGLRPELEDAVRRWRESGRHREAQSAGRGGIFADYRGTAQ